MSNTRSGWTFLTNHAAILLTINRSTLQDGDPMRVRDIADQVGVTERTVQHILNDLEESGYIVREHVGNRTHYQIHDDLPLRRPGDRDFGVGMLLGTLTHEASRPTPDEPEPGRPPATRDQRSALIATGTLTDADIELALRTLRTHLGLDVAFVSRIHAGHRVFTHVDADREAAPIEVGGRDPVEDSYCHYVVRGEIPQLLTDPSQHPVASRLPATMTLPVGTHLSVPIELADGDIYGTCCAFSYDVHEHLGDGDLAAVRALARLVAPHLRRRPTDELHDGQEAEKKDGPNHTRSARIPATGAFTR